MTDSQRITLLALLVLGITIVLWCLNKRIGNLEKLATCMANSLAEAPTNTTQTQTQI